MGDRRPGHSDLFFPLKPQRRLRGRAVHQHLTPIDELLYAGPADLGVMEFGKLRGEIMVESLFCSVGTCRQHDEENRIGLES